MRYLRDTTLVTLTKPFRLAIHEVTREQWEAFKAFMDAGGGFYRAERGANPAANNMTPEKAVEFCRLLTERERAAGRIGPDWAYRLPTEAEWEWACRAGTTTAYSFGDDEALLGEYAWFKDSTKGEGYSWPVGKLKPNSWGLYDMHGNVKEWCQDWFQDKPSGGVDPQGPAEGTSRVGRGGSWGDAANPCRSGVRKNILKARDTGIGFRVALSRTGDGASTQARVPAAVRTSTSPAVPTPPIVPSPPGRYAIEFAGARVSPQASFVSEVIIDTLDLDDERPVTLELAMTWEQGSAPRSIYLGHPDGLCIGTLSVNHPMMKRRSIEINAHEFNPHKQVYLALVYGDGTLRGFRDGKLVKTVEVDPTDTVPQRQPFVLGKGLKGRVAMARISSVARYTADYKPTLDFTPDQDTIALYRFDKDTGDVLEDLSGNNHHGKITGAKWVPVGDPSLSP